MVQPVHMAAIELDGVTKRFGEVEAVRDLTLEIPEGEIFGFLGPNGAGKSTTINMILDFVRPTKGTIHVHGLDAQKRSVEVRARTGVLPEGYSVYERLTGRQHVEFAMESKEVEGDPVELLERVGLEDAVDRKTGGYSKGMRQRLALAMALVGEPDLLILDEPSTGLDPTGAREMREIIQSEVDRGATVFFSSHILEHVERVCDRVGVLHDGRLVAVDTIGGLQESLGGGATVTVELDRPVADAVDSLPALEGVAEVVASGPVVEVTCAVPSAKAAVITRLDAAGATVLDVGIEDASLESLFSALTETGGSDRFRRGALDPDADGDASDGDDGALPDREVVA